MKRIVALLLALLMLLSGLSALAEKTAKPLGEAEVSLGQSAMGSPLAWFESVTYDPDTGKLTIELYNEVKPVYILMDGKIIATETDFHSPFNKIPAVKTISIQIPKGDHFLEIDDGSTSWDLYKLTVEKGPEGGGTEPAGNAFTLKKSGKTSLNVKGTLQISVPGKSIKSCKSSAAKVASVTAKGLVTAKKAGSAKITVTTTDKKKLTLTVTVVDPTIPTKVTLSQGKKATITAGDTLQLDAVIAPYTAKNAAVKWKSSKSSVASVNSAGLVTAKKAGTAKITATAGKKSATITITVKKKPAVPLTEEGVYNAMIAMKAKYPEGMPWTNANGYYWKGGVQSGGYGCHAFAMILSDAAFGKLKARKHSNVDKVRVGDILRINYNSHTVIVLQVLPDSFIVAEGNYNSSIHWGRRISRDEVKKTLSYILTRWPK